MSQRVKSNVIEKKCEGCGVVKEYEMVGLHERPLDMRDATGWTTLIREIFIPNEGFTKIMVQACSLECVPAAALKLLTVAIPEEPLDTNIDLAALQASQAN